MTIVNQLDKRSGLTYAYESISTWDPIKKQSRSKRKLIGRVDPATGQIIKTDGRGRRRKDFFPEETAQHSIPAVQRSFAGATYLFDRICEKLNIIQNLQECFPNLWKEILSIVYFQIMEDVCPLSRFEKWSRIHLHPFGENIPAQRSSEIFESITEDSKMKFFKLHSKLQEENEYWAFDSTTISSYSECLHGVEWEKNKESDELPQINLAILYGEKSKYPFYYRKLPGNVPDVKTIVQLLTESNFLEMKKTGLVLDRGYFSYDNIHDLYENNRKFLIECKISLAFAKSAISNVDKTIRKFENYNESYTLYAKTVKLKWNSSAKKPCPAQEGDTENIFYTHVYFNSLRAAEDEAEFNQKLVEYRNEILSGRRINKNESAYKKYFELPETEGSVESVVCKNDAILETKKSFGYFILVSNHVDNPIKALEMYRNKDVIEKAFSDIKGRLNCRRTRVSSDESLAGKLFVQFISLIILSYIKKQMQEADLFRKYTLHEVIDELDQIEALSLPGKTPIYGEILSSQMELYEAMNVTPPTSGREAVSP